MYLFEDRVRCVSPSGVIDNLEAVRRFVEERGESGSPTFSHAISILQCQGTPCARASCGPQIIWRGQRAAGRASTVPEVKTGLAPEPNRVYTASERRCLRRLIADGMQRLKRHFPGTYPVFCAAVPWLLMAKNEGHVAGSASSRIGFVWMSPTPSWTGHFCGECLYHEYIHQCLFLEDMVRTIFRDEAWSCTETDHATTVSAIRQVPRRFDQAYHSAFVVSGLIEYRVRSSDHSNAAALFPGLWACLEGLVRRRELLTTNGNGQLDELIDCANRQAEQLASHGESPPSFSARGKRDASQ